MKQILTTALSFFVVLAAFGQPSTAVESKESPEAKLYLPASILDDPAAMRNAVPGLASEMLTNLKITGTPYFKEASTYYFLAGDYKKAIDAIDSVQKKSDDPSWGADFKVYAKAKIKDKNDEKRFSEDFKKGYSEMFNKLTFGQKVYLAGLDTTALKELEKAYKESINGLKKNKSDSISTKEAKDFLSMYMEHSFYNEIYPIIPAEVNDPRYQTKFPAIKGNSWGGVYPVENPDWAADPGIKYKFLMELTSFGSKSNPDSMASKDINLAIRDIARTINLHVGAGIPKENIDVVLAVHGPALDAFLTNEKYKKKWNMDNPNIPLIKELQDFGVKVILCGQAMHFRKLAREDFIPGVKVSLTAQTVLSYYQLQNYVYYDLSIRD